MTKPLRVLLGRWLLGASAVASAAACSEDSAAPSAPVVAGGGTGSVDAGMSTSSPPIAASGSGPVESGGAGGSAGAAGSAPEPSDPDAGGGTPASCPPGVTQECQLDRLCTGVQTCGEDGTFGACDCGRTALVGSGVVGASCESDTDCGGGATCLRADGNEYLGVGGPAGGYCTFPCSGEADDCPTHDPQSFCAPLGPDQAGYCIRTCLSQNPEPGEAKCLNRPDLACVSAAADGFEPFNGQRQAGYCRPLCGSDEDCPAGRLCHRQSGICTDFPPPGAPIGAPCDSSDDCDGRECEGRIDGVGICTAFCVLGSLSGCGYGDDASLREAGCVIPVVAASNFSEGSGDLGFCLELCDVDTDCQQADAGFGCQAVNPELANFLGRRGACTRGAGANP